MAIVVIGGVIANKYLNGGAVWTRLNWLLGFKQLGFQVYLMEQIAGDQCLDAAGKECAFQECENLRYFKRIMNEFDLLTAGILIYENGKQIYGSNRSDLLDLAASADLLVNISGHLAWEPFAKLFRKKIYIDLDPGFTQLWCAAGNLALAGYDHYFTVGENISMAQCSIPTNEVHWCPVRQPVVLNQWPFVPSTRSDRFTTIASWRGPYGRVPVDGKLYGVKAQEFRRFIELPQYSEHEFEIALDIHAADQKDATGLRESGWRLVDPKRVVPDPFEFRNYVQRSSAEFSVAQGIYVETRSGWFSDRTVRYLASGKPALVQDTGFSQNLPVGDGLVAFRRFDEAVAGAHAITGDYARHSRAARVLAEEYFDSDKVLGKLIEYVGVSP